MEIKNRDKIIEFYESEIYQDGSVKPEELTDMDITYLGKTGMFARWMLANSIEDVKIAFKDTINKFIKWK